jgi:hypothetical protein
VPVVFQKLLAKIRFVLQAQEQKICKKGLKKTNALQATERSFLF